MRKIILPCPDGRFSLPAVTNFSVLGSSEEYMVSCSTTVLRHYFYKTPSVVCIILNIYSPFSGNRWTSKGTCNFSLRLHLKPATKLTWNIHSLIHSEWWKPMTNSVTLHNLVDPWCLWFESGHCNCWDHRVSSS